MKKFLQNNYYIALCFTFSVLSLGIGKTVFADETTQRANVLGNLGKTAKAPFGANESGKLRSDQTPGKLVGDLVEIALGFVGTIAFLVFLYGGFLWLTARGNEDQVGKAKKYLTNGAIGTVIVIVAYAATFFITAEIYKATR